MGIGISESSSRSLLCSTLSSMVLSKSTNCVLAIICCLSCCFSLLSFHLFLFFFVHNSWSTTLIVFRGCSVKSAPIMRTSFALIVSPFLLHDIDICSFFFDSFLSICDLDEIVFIPLIRIIQSGWCQHWAHFNIVLTETNLTSEIKDNIWRLRVFSSDKMVPVFFLRLSKVWSITSQCGRVHNKMLLNAFIYFFSS